MHNFFDTEGHAGYICPTCGRHYSDPDNCRAIDKLSERLACDHGRAELIEQQKEVV